MEGALLGFVLDVVILACLGTVIYYAFRLSRSLENFKSHRAEMRGLIATLTKNIDRAQAAIEELKGSSSGAGKEMHDLISESRMLFDELQIMNEAGNNLAERLEKLTDQAAPAGRPQAEKSNLSMDSIVDISSRSQKDKSSESEEGPFLIRDRDFEEPSEGAEDEGLDWSDDGQDLSVPEDLQSQAEKELYKALQKKQKSAGQGQ